MSLRIKLLLKSAIAVSWTSSGNIWNDAGESTGGFRGHGDRAESRIAVRLAETQELDEMKDAMQELKTDI